MNQSSNRQSDEERIAAIDRRGNTTFVGTYAEVIEAIKKNPELGVDVVHVWLAQHSPNGNIDDPLIIFQRRSDNNRLDKSAGGHVPHGLSFDQAALKELDEEIHGLHVELVSDLGAKAIGQVDLTKSAAVMPFSGMPWDISERYGRDGETYTKPTRVVTYIGFYDGSLDAIEHDFEVTGMQAMPLSEALRKIQSNPELFTPDTVKHLPAVAEALISTHTW